MTTLSDAELFDLLGPEPPPGDPPPWEHQAREFDEHKDDRFRVLLWSMRTGKSRAVIEKAEYQFSKGNVEGVIVVAPNGIHLNWIINEIPRWSKLPHKAFGWQAPLRGDWDKVAAADAIVEPYPGGLRWLTINMEAFGSDNDATRSVIKLVDRFKRSCNKKFMLVISEAHHFGHAGAKRTRLIKQLGNMAKFVTLETGTAILNSPLRAYSIYKIGDDLALGPEYVGNKYESFVQRHANIVIVGPDGKPVSTFNRRNRARKKVESYKNLDELRDKIAPWSSVVLRSDVKDMPDLLRTERIIMLSEKQRKAYLEMVSRHLIEIEGRLDAPAPDAGARMIKLAQILKGFVKVEDQIINIDEEAPVYQAMLDEVYGTLPGKTIIWCRFHEEVDRCMKILKFKKFRPLQFDGRVPTEKREGIRVAFNTDPRYNPLVGHPGAGGEGLNFGAADTVVFFSSTPNAIHVTQGEERGTEIGGNPVSVVRFRAPGTTDDRNWDIVDGKLVTAEIVTGRDLRDLLMQTNV